MYLPFDLQYLVNQFICGKFQCADALSEGFTYRGFTHFFKNLVFFFYFIFKILYQTDSRL